MRRLVRLRTVQALLLAAVSASLAGCGGTSASIRYYTVGLPAAPDAAQTAYPVTLLVARVTAPTILHDDRILYRSGANEIGTYEYHRWAEPPAAMLETRLLRILRESGRYQSVAETSSKVRGDFVVRGRLYDFEEVDASAISGRVALEVELLDQKAGKVVWSHFYSHDEPANGTDVVAIVEALNTNVRRSLEEIAQGVDEYFAKTWPATGSKMTLCRRPRRVLRPGVRATEGRWLSLAARYPGDRSACVSLVNLCEGARYQNRRLR